MFIEVNKVVEEQQKVEDGSGVRNPHDTTPVKSLILCPEVIRLEEIKSFRAWRKTPRQNEFVEGPIIKLYMFGDRSKDGNPEMLIAEDFNSFADRVAATRLKNGKEEK